MCEIERDFSTEGTYLLATLYLIFDWLQMFLLNFDRLRIFCAAALIRAGVKFLENVYLSNETLRSYK